MNITTYFCQIDVKDYNSPVNFEIDGQTFGNKRILNKVNSRLSVLMEREYLTRLFSLQQEIEQKYTSIFDKTDDFSSEKNRYNNDGLTREEYYEVKQEAKNLFPGKEAEYYT